jgi:cell shape-determining protein MreD
MLNGEDVTSNIGLRMVMGLSYDVAYYNLMGLNVLSIRL